MVCKTPKYIFASTSTIPEPFFSGYEHFFWIWTSYTFMQRMGCNDFKSPTSDTPIQKYNAQNAKYNFLL